jgi:molybdenum cofactor cytidylyltransferase
MPPRPTIVVLAAGAAAGRVLQLLGAKGDAAAARVLGRTVRHAIETGWPVVVVATPALAPVLATWVATRDLVVVDPATDPQAGQQLIAVGVAAQADADGWLLLPADCEQVRAASIQAVGRALQDSPVAYAQYQGREGLPVGFAAELFSELVTLDRDDAIRRLMSRYPARGIEVDDPAVVVAALPLPDGGVSRGAAAGPP